MMKWRSEGYEGYFEATKNDRAGEGELTKESAPIKDEQAAKE